MAELLEAVEQHGDGDEVARDRGEDGLGTFERVGEAREECERACAEGEFAQGEGGGETVAWILEPAGGIHDEDENEEGECEYGRGEAGLDLGDEAQAAEDETGADGVGPEVVPGNPCRDE